MVVRAEVHPGSESWQRLRDRDRGSWHRRRIERPRHRIRPSPIGSRSMTLMMILSGSTRSTIALRTHGSSSTRSRIWSRLTRKTLMPTSKPAFASTWFSSTRFKPETDSFWTSNFASVVRKTATEYAAHPIGIRHKANRRGCNDYKLFSSELHAVLENRCESVSESFVTLPAPITTTASLLRSIRDDIRLRSFRNSEHIWRSYDRNS